MSRFPPLDATLAKPTSITSINPTQRENLQYFHPSLRGTRDPFDNLPVMRVRRPWTRHFA